MSKRPTAHEATKCAQWLRSSRRYLIQWTGSDWLAEDSPLSLSNIQFFMTNAQLIEFCEVRGYPGPYHDPIVEVTKL